MTDLETLAFRVEQATGPNAELDLAIATASYELGFPIFGKRVNYDPALWLERYGSITASIDAAMTLVGEDWRAGFEQNARCDEPGKSYAWVWPFDSSYDPDWQLGQEGQQSNPDAVKGYAATPALALAAAALRSRAEQPLPAPPCQAEMKGGAEG